MNNMSRLSTLLVGVADFSFSYSFPINMCLRVYVRGSFLYLCSETERRQCRLHSSTFDFGVYVRMPTTVYVRLCSTLVSTFVYVRKLTTLSKYRVLVLKSYLS